MKITRLSLNNYHTPSFQKTLVAKTNILCNDKPKDAFIYKLDRTLDKDYFSNLLQEGSSWKDGFLIYSASRDMQLYDDNYYVLEDSEEECLGYLISRDYNDDFYNSTTIRKLETVPKYSNRIPTREVKHIGKALIDFMKQLTSKKEDCELYVSSPLSSALSFYEKQGFAGSLTGCVLKYFFPEEQTTIEFVE